MARELIVSVPVPTEAIVEPAGMPGPAMTMPAERPAMFVKVTVLLPEVVPIDASVTWGV